MRLSSRALRIGESATLRVARRASELKARGVDVVDFGAGEPDFPSPPAAVAAARQGLADGFTKYTQSSGIPELRTALADRYRNTYGAPWSIGDTLVAVGGKGALFETALALFDDGDEVVLHTPCWVSLPEQIRFAGASVVPVPTSGSDGFAVHAQPIIAALTPKTRAVILNSPCNPTGGIISALDLGAVIAACAVRGVVVISDETYERFVFDSEPVSAASWATRYPETVAVVGSFSKTYAMTGWRLGYLLGPRELVAAAAAIQSHATSNATSFAMLGALAALEHCEADVAAMIAEYRVRRDLVVEALCRMRGVTCRPPAGTFYAFPDVSACFGAGVPGSTEFAERLLEEEAVAVVAGEAFGGDRHVRISFACSRETLARGLERFAAFCARLATSN